MKKFLSMTMAALMIASLLTGCGSSADASTSGQTATGDKPVELKMNVTTSESSVWMVAANTFKVMRSATRFTSLRSTPGSFRVTRSTDALQAAQCIPEMSYTSSRIGGFLL